MSEKFLNECKEVKEKLSEYIAGTLEQDEAERVEEHFEKCESCRNEYEILENERFLAGDKKSDVIDTRKLESRFTRKIVSRVLGVCALVLIGFYAVFGVILPSVFSSSMFKKSEELGYAVKDLVQFTIPGARLKGGYEGTTTLFDLIRIAEYEQLLAGGGLRTGRVDIAIPLYAGRTDWEITSEQSRSGSGYVFHFSHKRSQSSLERVWEKLEKIGGGTKTIAAVYFENPISTHEMQGILKEIEADERYTWLSIDTGDAVEWEYDFDKPYKELRMHSPQWGFPTSMPLTPTTARSVIRDSKGRVTSMSGGNKAYDIPEIAERFKKEMKQLEVYSQKYFNAEEFTGDIRKINEYIEEAGIRINGAILGASTVNMLKLKDEPNIARVDIVKVDFDY